MEALKTLFPSHIQVIVWKSAHNDPISIESYTFEGMEAAIAFNLLGDSQEEFETLNFKSAT